jgi:tryptophan 2,3-dioxygenase
VSVFLLPASGFQSAQYRLIELNSTDLINLVAPALREAMQHQSPEAMLEAIYWRKGATELASGKKTLTLQHFEKKYAKNFLDTALEFRYHNLNQLYLKMEKAGQMNAALENEMRQYDHYANVQWPIMHLRSAARYLRKDPEDIAATGGTNWQDYLPPKKQQIMFFPKLWTDQEIREWGQHEVLTESLES